jgi:hypothetical protein
MKKLKCTGDLVWLALLGGGKQKLDYWQERKIA